MPDGASNLWAVGLFFAVGVLVMIYPTARRYWRTGKIMKKGTGDGPLIEMDTYAAAPEPGPVSSGF